MRVKAGAEGQNRTADTIGHPKESGTRYLLKLTPEIRRDRRGGDAGLGVLVGRLGWLLQQLIKRRGGVFGDDQPLRFRPWFLLRRWLAFLSHDLFYATLEIRVVRGEKKVPRAGFGPARLLSQPPGCKPGVFTCFTIGAYRSVGAAAGWASTPTPSSSSSGPPTTAPKPSSSLRSLLEDRDLRGLSGFPKDILLMQ